MTELLTTARLAVTSCCVCGISFAVPDSWLEKRREVGDTFYCPNGHSLTFRRSEAQKLRETVSRLEMRTRHLEDQCDASERSRRALRGSNTKLRKRIASTTDTDEGQEDA